MKIAVRAAFVAAIIMEAGFAIAVALGWAVDPMWILLPIALVVITLGVVLAQLPRARRTQTWPAAIDSVAERSGIPRLPIALAVSEATMFRQLLPFRGQRTLGENTVAAFTSHHGLKPIVFAVLGLTVVESIVMHLAVGNNWISWLVLAVSLYGFVLLTGFYLAIARHRHTLTADCLTIRSGYRTTATIDRTNIAAVAECSPGEGGSLTFRNDVARIPVLSEANIRVTTHQPVLVSDLFKGEQKVTAIEFLVDDKAAFLAAARGSQSGS